MITQEMFPPPRTDIDHGQPFRDFAKLKDEERAEKMRSGKRAIDTTRLQRRVPKDIQAEIDTD